MFILNKKELAIKSKFTSSATSFFLFESSMTKTKAIVKSKIDKIDL